MSDIFVSSVSNLTVSLVINSGNCLSAGRRLPYRRSIKCTSMILFFFQPISWVYYCCRLGGSMLPERQVLADGSFSSASFWLLHIDRYRAIYWWIATHGQTYSKLIISYTGESAKFLRPAGQISPSFKQSSLARGPLTLTELNAFFKIEFEESESRYVVPLRELNWILA